MNTYVTGSTIRQLREAKGLTQAELAEMLSVSAKTISKWETAKGLPDISLLEPLAAALGVSVLELMQGEPIINRNRAANLLRSKLYVCPLCGNVLHATGQAVVSCCGITLPALDIAEAEDADEHHQLGGDLPVQLRHGLVGHVPVAKRVPVQVDDDGYVRVLCKVGLDRRARAVVGAGIARVVIYLPVVQHG